MSPRRAGAAAGARAGVAAGTGLLVLLALAGCADVPGPAAAPGPTATTAPAVLTDQAERVRGEVAGRLLAARVAGDPALVDLAVTGPAAMVEALRLQVDGSSAGSTAEQPVPAAVLVAPQGPGWPRWFATVTDPSTAPLPAASTDPVVPTAATDAPAPTADPGASGPPAAAQASPGAPGEAAAPVPSGDVADDAVVRELPVMELYTSESPRLPYRLWGRLTVLPGAELPAFPATEVGAVPFAGGDAPEPVPSEESSAEGEAPAEEPDEAAAEEAELLAAVTGLGSRYASVMTDGDASPYAAEFEPDRFVEAVRARAAAESAAVAVVADTTVQHRPLGGTEVLYAARAANGDLLAVTAVETTVTMTVRPGSGVLRPGTEVRAAAGVEETDDELTTRSVATLAFVVPAEKGALRLVAVGEGLVSASAR